MEVKINKCNILVEPWQFQCCGEPVHADTTATLIVGQYCPKVLGEWLKVDFVEDHHDIGFLELKGHITGIKAVFEKILAENGYAGEPENEYFGVEIPYFDGWEQHECYKDYAHLGKEPAYYQVTMENVTLSPHDGKETSFSINTADIECGWENVAINVNGAVIDFVAGYCAEEPVNSLVHLLSDIKDHIDAGAVGKSIIETCWDSEPSILRMKAEVLPLNIVSLHILTEPFYFSEPKDERQWQITMPYQDFYDAIVSATTRQLMRQGIVGISKSWLSEDDPIFPVRKYLEILGCKTSFDKDKSYCFSSNILDELEMIKQAIFQERDKTSNQ